MFCLVSNTRIQCFSNLHPPPILQKEEVPFEPELLADIEDSKCQNFALKQKKRENC